MQSTNNDVSPRSYSTRLSMAPQSDVVGPIYDDMTIAEGLLNNSKVPYRSSSFTGTQGFARSNGKFASSAALTDASAGGTSRRALRTSNTWTSSSGDVLSDQDEVDDRTIFVQEFNRLARKHVVRPMVQDDDDAGNDDSMNLTASRDNWFSRKILRRTSSTQSVKPERHMKHRRSISDLSLRMKLKKDKLKDKDLQELVRLCGSSLLYLPTEYAAGSLAVPTCFRATAQYLVQYGTTTRGVFRIPGSHNVVAALYNHYCSMDQNGEAIAGTVRCPTLPEHIRCDVHDVASAFKKFISGLPGGILGSLPLFDSLISIQSQLHGDPEFTRTKQSKVRARLIALAIATLRSQFRRKLICAVFGLLCMIGRAAETSRREDERGRPLPTSDLMGYGPLGIIFGPLLVGDLLEDYTMRHANPHGGLILLPISPPKSRKERKKKTKSGGEGDSFNTYVDKIKVANGIAEMLITHWRDVVRHMKNLSALKVVGCYKSLGSRSVKPPFLRPSASESFAIRKPPDRGDVNPMRPVERSASPTPMRRVSSPMANPAGDLSLDQNDSLKVRKRRSNPRPLSSQRLSVAKSLSVLSPTAEEHAKENESAMHSEPSHMKEKSNASSSSNKENRPLPDDVSKGKTFPPHSSPESLCSASKEKSMTIHAQPIDHRKYMEPSLSLVTGVPMETPKTFRSTNKEFVVHFEKGKATESVTREISRQSTPIAGSTLGPPAAQPTRTLLKPLSPSPPPQNSSRSLGPVAWAKKSLSSMQSRGSGEIPPPIPNQRKPKVLLFRASTRDSEERVPKDERRLGGSDPGMPTKVPDRSPRKVSKSLYDDPQRKRKLLELDYAKKFPTRDPLASISQEEDLASLAELAQALDFLEEQDGANSGSKTDGVKQEMSSLTGSGKTTRTSDWREGASMVKSSEHEARAAQVRDPKINRPTATGEKRIEQRNPSPSKVGSKSQATSTDSIVAGPPTPKRILAITNPATPKSQTNQQRNPVGANPGNLPGSPSSKFSALVEKFNNPGSQTTPDRSPLRPPKKSLTIFMAEDDHKRNNSPSGGLIAPYTTNPPSPTKSQKSGKSDNTRQSLRPRLSSNGKQDTHETPKSQRGVPPARKDGMLLRRVQESPEVAALAKQPSPTPSPIACRQPPCPVEVVQTSPTEPSLANEDSECPYIVEKIVDEALEQGKDKSPNEFAIPAQSENDTALAMEVPSSKHSLVSPEGISNSPSVVSNEVLPFDGPAGTLNIHRLPVSFYSAETELSRTKSSPSLQETPSFVHPDSPFKDAFTTSNPVSPTGSPPLPGRSNSVLYAQIRTLQRQLASKTEETRQLKKQLDARSSLDIGTLSEQLREAKKEIQMWKTRAEVAEKQIEMFTKMPPRSNSRPTSIRSQSSQVLKRASTGYAGEAADMAARIRKALHGMDGTESPPRWSSEESSDTVIREPIAGSEQSV